MTLVEIIASLFMTGAFLCMVIPLGIAVIVMVFFGVKFAAREARDLKKRGL